MVDETLAPKMVLHALTLQRPTIVNASVTGACSGNRVGEEISRIEARHAISSTRKVVNSRFDYETAPTIRAKLFSVAWCGESMSQPAPTRSLAHHDRE